MTHIKGEITAGDNFTAAQIGPLNELDDYQFTPGKFIINGKLFLKEALGLTGMEVSLGKMVPGSAVPYTHQHKENEELYLFIKGTGQFQIDGELIDVREGTCIRVGTGGARTWRNNSTEDLYYIVIQAKEDSLGLFTLTDGKLVSTNPEWPE